MKRTFCVVFFVCMLACCGFNMYAQETDNHVIATNDGSSVYLEWYADNIVRIVKTPNQKAFPEKECWAVTAEPKTVRLKTRNCADEVIYETSALRVSVSRDNGVVKFSTKNNLELVKEAAAAKFVPFDDAGRPTYTVTQSWALAPSEDIYGFGILQNGKMSQRGENRDLRPGNTEDGVPFFQSDKGYGIYWDNYSTTKVTDANDVISLTAEVGDAVDYYFIYGGNADGVIAGVRALTGKVPMIPLWGYGFMQSRERYKSQKQLLEVLHRYRKDGVPIDCMIQDWQYWGPNYLWNAMEFLNEGFPNPKAMLDEVHANNAKCMISIWSSFGPMTKQYKELSEKGLLFDMATWPESGISHVWPPMMDYPSGVKVYDCYSPEARNIYWNNLRRLYDLGLDGWWMDSTEPDHFDWKKEDFDHQTAKGSYRSVLAAFPLMTVEGVYDHQRATSDSTRVFILTRSGFFGQQRTGANVWSGDVVSTWDMLRKQVPAGLNFSLTGNPNFNSDLGGFFAGSYNWAWKNKPAYENPAYHELYVRWSQYGALTPMMRSHGADVPRELYYYGTAGEPVYDALVGAIKQRYQLLPYIYSTAWQVSKNDDTFMRALVMDFPNDDKAKALNNQYMFGRSILAVPVLDPSYTPEVIRHDADANAGWDKNTGKTTIKDLDNVDFTKNSVHTPYLPKGSKWYYFHDGQMYDGGQDVQLDLPLGEVPFFVKAGSILPLGPDVQWTSEKPWDNLEIRVYPGANGEFTLYEDSGNGYGYEKGEYSEIDMKWNDRTRTFTIADRKGQYPGMLKVRKFTVALPDGTNKVVEYSGKKTTIKI